MTRLLLFATLLAPAAAAQGWLDVARWYLHPTAGEFHAIADVDSDGDDDLIWFVGEPGTPTVWEGFQVAYNDGQGDFATLGPFHPITGPNRLRPLDADGVGRLADLTGDGLVDLPLLERTPSFVDVAIHVFPGMPAGAFGAPITIPIVGRFDAAAIGDPDADGIAELLLVDEIDDDEHIAWYDWTGAGFASTGEVVFPGGISSPSVAGTAVLDIDGDGDDDLVYGQWDGPNLRVLPSVGGAVTLGATIPLPGGDPSDNLDPFVADLAGGSATDLLVVRTRIGSAQFELVPVLHVGATLVPGTPQPFTGTGAIGGTSFAVGDWDGDGDADALSYPWELPGQADDGILAIFANDGADGFGTAPAAQVDLVYEGPASIGLADLDGDGRLDYVGSRTAFFGNGVVADSLAEVTSIFFGPDPRVVADHEGDGDLDLYYAGGGILSIGPSVRLNDGTGAFPGTVGVPPPPPGLTYRLASGIADFTGDGRTDVLVPLEAPQPPFGAPLFVEMRLLADDGLGGFVDLGVASASSMEPYARALNVAHDLDADGDNDLLDRSGQGGFWENDGSGVFAGFVPLFTEEPEAVADVDDDGDPDVVTYGFISTALSLARNDGALSFSEEGLYASGALLHPDSVALRDLDADGDLDLAFAQTTHAEAIVLMSNDGTGAFAQAALLDTLVSGAQDPPFVHALFEDVDADGVLDAVVGGVEASSTDPARVALFRGTGPFAFEPRRFYAAASVSAAGDLDGDGDLDLAGRGIVRTRRFDGAADGIVRQYGTGTAGSGGAVPVLGASGPLRPGSASAALHARRGLGGATMFLAYGFADAASPALGGTLYVGSPFFLLALPLGGPPGVPGAGALDAGLTGILPAAAGLTLFHQALVYDPQPGQKWALSNGLQLTYGL